MIEGVAKILIFNKMAKFSYEAPWYIQTPYMLLESIQTIFRRNGFQN